MTVLLLHGLEGSSNSQYVIGNANKLWRAGDERHPHEHAQLRRHRALSRRRSTTPACRETSTRDALLPGLGTAAERIALVGYSMGGNLVLKLDRRARRQRAATAALAPSASLPPSISALRPTRCTRRRTACTSAGSSAHLLRRFRKKCMLFPQVFDPCKRADGDRTPCATSTIASPPSTPASPIRGRLLRTAPPPRACSTASRVPTLILHALDDPFVTAHPTHPRHHRRQPRHHTRREPNTAATAPSSRRPNPAPVTGPTTGYWAGTTTAAPAVPKPSPPISIAGPEIIDSDAR